MSMALAELVDLAAKPGRRSVPVTAEYVRDLRVEDVAATAVEHGFKPAQLKEIRHTHHSIARLLAGKRKEWEVSAIVGISVNRISILKNDPAFQELLSHYEEMEAKGYELARADMHERLAQFGFDTMEVLHQKLLESPESFTTKELMMAVELAADRTGHGKTSTVNSNVQHSVSPETLERLRAIGEGPARVAETHREALLGLAVRATDVHTDSQTVEWIECEGTLVREEVDPDVGGDVGVGPPLPSVD